MLFQTAFSQFEAFIEYQRYIIRAMFGWGEASYVGSSSHPSSNKLQGAQNMPDLFHKLHWHACVQNDVFLKDSKKNCIYLCA